MYKSQFKEAKNEGSFLNGTQTGRKVMSVITKLLKDNDFIIMSSLGKIGWIVTWNGFEIKIDFRPSYKLDAKGFYSNIKQDGEEEKFDKAFNLIKKIYANAKKDDNKFLIEIPSEE